MSTENKKTAEIIRNGRLSKGYTQLKLSELTKVSLRSIQRIESGEVKPRRDTLALLVAELDISPKNFVFIEQDDAQSIQPKASQPNKLILHIGTALIMLLLGAAYLSQSPTFPETTFELLLFWAAVILLYLIVTFRKSRQ